jgi:hypothetical protein
MGIPFLGPQLRMYRSICKQLEDRNPEVLESWGFNPSRRHAVEIVSRIIAERNEWPNSLFIPEDPLWILTWNRHSTAIDELADLDITSHIEKALDVNLRDCRWVDPPYGRFIDDLLGLPRRSVTR